MFMEGNCRAPGVSRRVYTNVREQLELHHVEQVMQSDA